MQAPNPKLFFYFFVSSLLFVAVFLFLNQFQKTPTELESLLAEETDSIEVPKGLPPISWPKDNPYNKKKAELGRLLYFDKRLSSDGTVSCATCHKPPAGYTDNLPVSEGIHGHKGVRNSPTVINTVYLKELFWDGRANSLEEQCKGPIANPNEMTSEKDAALAHQNCEDKICAIKGYQILFKEVFGTTKCSIDDIAKAIATFERTILSGNSPYDRYLAGDQNAMTKEEIAGYEVFKSARCINCHLGPNFNNGKFVNIGVGMDKPNPDLGRYAITHDEKDWGAFKIPTLREVSKTYPYMHDGSLQTLEEVVEYYDKGGIPNKNLHPLIRPLNLSEEDKKNLVSFMKAIDGEGWEQFTEPAKFPE